MRGQSGSETTNPMLSDEITQEAKFVDALNNAAQNALRNKRDFSQIIADMPKNALKSSRDTITAEETQIKEEQKGI